MNKIDDFFKNRLDDKASKDEGWNMPSEDLWNAAVPHFPKKKKKRSFLWVWMSLSFVLGSSLMIWYTADENNPTIQSEINVESGINEKSIDVIDVSNEIVATKTLLEKGQISFEDNQFSNSIVKPADEVEKQSSQRDFESHNSNLKKEKAKGIEYSSLKAKEVNGSGVLSLNQSISLPAQILDSKDLKGTDVVEGIEAKANTVEAMVTKESDLYLSENKFDSNQSKVNFMAIQKIENGNTPYIVSKKQMPANHKEFPFIKPKIQVRPDKEVGISSQLFLLNLLNGKDLDESADGRIIFEGRYRNLNFKYTKWVGRKWSISTGLNVSDLTINVDFATNVEYDENEFEELVEFQFGESINRNYNSNSSKIIKLKPGVELFNGDLIGLSGNVNLGLTAVQVPIMLNYHWYNKRVEFYTGVGMTLESIWAVEEDGDIQLFEDGTLISEEVPQTDVNEAYLDYSVYTKLGAKYNITKNFNLDVALSILVTEPVFSGIEIGLHYRWYQ